MGRTLASPRGSPSGVRLLSVAGKMPRIADSVFLAPGCVVVGDVEIGPHSSVWFNAVIRGDSAPVRIGSGTNVQDNAVLHVDPDAPCTIGNDVTIGHGAIVHGTTVGDGVTIGMGAIVLSRSRIGARAVIAAGAVVAEDAMVEPGALMMGVPAREKRILEPERQSASAATAAGYVRNAARFAETMRAEPEASGGETTDGG